MNERRTIVNRHAWWLVLPCIGLALGLALPWLNRDLIWFDEYYSQFFAGAGNFPPVTLPEMFLRHAMDIWPPLHSFALAPWDWLVAGDAQFLGRILQAYIGLISIALLARMAHDLFGSRVAIFAGILMATNQVLIWYLHELRPYTLWVLLLILTLWLYIRMLRSFPSVGVRRGFTLSVAALLYTHHLSVLFMIGLGLHFLWMRTQLNRVHWGRVFWHLFLGGVLYAPWIAFTFLNVQEEAANPRNVSRLQVWGSIALQYTNGLPWLFLPLAALSLRYIREQAVQVLLAVTALYALVSIGADFFVSFFFHMRYMMVLVPVLAVLLAVVLAHWWQRFPAIVVGVLLLWGFAGAVAARNGLANDVPEDTEMNGAAVMIPVEQMRITQQVTRECMTADDYLLLALNPAHEDDIWILPYSYYLPADQINFGLLGTLTDVQAGPPPDRSSMSDADRMDEMLAGHENVYWMQSRQYPLEEPGAQFASALRERAYTDCGVFVERDGVQGHVWSQEGERCRVLLEGCAGRIED